MNISRLISLDVLREHSGVSLSTINNGVSNTETKSWICYNVGGAKFVDFDSIPGRTKTKLSYQQLLSHDAILNELNQNKKIEEEITFIELQLLISIQSEKCWRPCVKYVKDHSRTFSRTQELAQLYSFWERIIHLKNCGFTKKEIWISINTSEQIQSYKFIKCKSLPHFTQMIKRGQSDGIVEIIVNKNFGTKNESRRKLTPWHQKKILKIFF